MIFVKEVCDSIPPSSTRYDAVLWRIVNFVSPSSRGLGHCPFTAATGVRIPLGTPLKIMAIKLVSYRRCKC
ncbi:uncharacterized protein METZ01_LOCUS169894 [marine metagenome]|uniref:Uncharacterized protein n=1 Tax=marine metagenome TaxID=408172 RepID=A0A382BT94_9ZZZZ